MMPRPMNPTVVMRASHRFPRRTPVSGASSVGAWVGCRPLFGRQPAEAVGAGPAWFVFQTHPAVVVGLRELPQVVLDRKLTRAGLVPARGVGDLHMTDAGEIGRDRLRRIIAVDREVVQVAQETQVG